MASSKTLPLIVVLIVATVLFVSSEVVAQEMTGTSNTVDTSEKSKGEVNDAKYLTGYGAYPGGGYGGDPGPGRYASYHGGGYGGDPGPGRYGGDPGPGGYGGDPSPSRYGGGYGGHPGGRYGGYPGGRYGGYPVKP